MMRLSFGSNAENGSNLSALDRDTSPAPANNGTPRFRNFDLLRLVAATSVVFSHAFDIVNGNEHAEPLVMLLGPGNILGIYGVYTFFIISGFLITASFKKSSFSSYALKRCLRIFPGLIVCTIVTTSVALLLSSRGVPSSHALKEGARYVVKTLLLYDTSSASLPGVVFSSNDFGRIFNGCLWSLGPEFLCYAGVAALGVLGMLGLRGALAVLALGLYTHHAGLLGNVGEVLPFFAAGAVMYFWRERPALGKWTFACAAAGLLAGALLGLSSIAFALFGSWLMISFATGPLQIAGATRFGDLSYGIYLYGWPIEETLRYLLGTSATWWLVFLLAMPIASCVAMISWHVVEGPSLRLAGSRTFGFAKARAMHSRASLEAP
jgi:peptidoglycan/LPS O-acetylase OafA/YrhL